MTAAETTNGPDMAANGEPGKPQYGRRLIPHIIDEAARKHPDKECMSIPRSSDPSDGWRVVTWKEFATSVNHIAHRMVEECGSRLHTSR